MLTMLFTLDMPSLWDLSRASGDTVAPYVFVPPCFYPPHLRKHHAEGDYDAMLQDQQALAEKAAGAPTEIKRRRCEGP